MEKYITVGIPRWGKNKKYVSLNTSKDAIEIINILEEENSQYDFHQFVITEEYGINDYYSIMKLKSK